MANPHCQHPIMRLQKTFVGRRDLFIERSYAYVHMCIDCNHAESNVHQYCAGRPIGCKNFPLWRMNGGSGQCRKKGCPLLIHHTNKMALKRLSEV